MYPESVQAPVALGNVYLSEKRNEDAARWYGRAIGIDPRNMSARCNLAGALANQGKYEEAVRELEAALRIDPNHPIATERLKVIREYLPNSSRRGFPSFRVSDQVYSGGVKTKGA